MDSPVLQPPTVAQQDLGMRFVPLPDQFKGNQSVYLSAPQQCTYVTSKNLLNCRDSVNQTVQ